MKPRRRGSVASHPPQGQKTIGLNPARVYAGLLGNAVICNLVFIAIVYIYTNYHFFTWSQSYDFYIYSYNASVVVHRLERFFKLEDFFVFKTH
jgi:hypothetical protein